VPMSGGVPIVPTPGSIPIALAVGRTAVVLGLCGLLAGCASATSGRGSGGPSQSSGGELVVYAAASLTDVFHDLAPAYEEAHPGVHIVLASDSSAALRTRIEQGAPADVFAAADTENPARLARAGLTRGSPVAFARNRLAIVVPADNPARIRDPADLARVGVRIVAAAEGVPITAYATDLLRRLAALPGAPADLVARVEANVVSREDNVSAVLAKVELGEGDAAIVYETDARAGSNVRSVPIPDEANVYAVYAAVAVAPGSQGSPAADDFVRWLRGAGAQAILGAAGFLAAP
jgi:molybdate transport system substrate-binding protein